MNRKQITLLLLISVLIYVVGNSITSLASLRVREFGADDTAMGLYFAVSYAALAVGAMSSGSLSNRFQRRKHFIIGVVCSVYQPLSCWAAPKPSKASRCSIQFCGCCSASLRLWWAS